METAPDHMIIVSTQGNHDNEEFGVVIWAGFIGVKEDTVEMHAAIRHKEIQLSQGKLS